MAIETLFVISKDILKSKLKLSGASSSDTLTIIDSAIEKVRIGFYDSLGAPRIAQLLAITYAENATTANQLLRTKANQTEISWVRLHLLQELPSLFIDGSSQVDQDWNDEGLTREANYFDTKEQISKLQLEVEQNLVQLAENETERPKLTVSVIEPDTTPDAVGTSIF